MRDAAVISIIPLSHLAVAFMPALLVIALFYWWQLKIGSVVYAFVRMLVQLLLVGYFFTVDFQCRPSLDCADTIARYGGDLQLDIAAHRDPTPNRSLSNRIGFNCDWRGCRPGAGDADRA